MSEKTNRMKTLFENIKGDRLIWAIVALLAIVSFLPVYSASSDLAYDRGEGNTFVFFVKHFMHLFLGFGIMCHAAMNVWFFTNPEIFPREIHT